MLNEKAFTLIELLVSIAIIFLMAGLSLAGYSRLNKRQNLIAAGLNMKNILRDAQSRAYNSEIDCSVCSCTVGGSSFTGWMVDFGGKRIFGNCGTTNFTVNDFRGAYNFSDEIMINANPTGVLFKGYPNNSVTPLTICLYNTNDTATYYRLSLSPSGIASDAGIVSSCP